MFKSALMPLRLDFRTTDPDGRDYVVCMYWEKGKGGGLKEGDIGEGK